MTAALLITLLACAPRPTTVPPSSGVTAPSPWPQSFSVLTYNTYYLPEAYFANDAALRATLLLEQGVLWGYDAIVFQELFDERARTILLRGLADAYPYRTPIVGSRHGLLPAGGVLIVSRWPIEVSAQTTFGAICASVDCLADKGIVYARIRKGSRRYHLFGTHAQSGDEDRFQSVREAQFELFHDFLAAQEIPAAEAVILAGDFNVDGYDTTRFRTSLRLLGATAVIPAGGDYSWDGPGNILATGRQQQLLDHLLLAAPHLQPLLARAEVLRARSERYEPRDLSDHHPVSAQLLFPSALPTVPR